MLDSIKGSKMSENIQKLSDKIAAALEYSDVEIPPHIVENINKDLRPYQVSALKHYLLHAKKPSTNHLMFNMATGSGKTLIMAALMLDCFKKGYENFIFFVDKTTIVEKTKENFANKYGSKYLFKEHINIDSKNVEINVINSLDSSKNGCINIYFTTIQSLYSLFTNERENAITLSDLIDIKLVFLADEAHHLNSETKNKLLKDEEEIKQGWESVIKQAFNSNPQNLMFEFTATIPKIQEVIEKYRDKIIYEYDLAKFCKDGFSKRIFLMKYENQSLNSRFLGGVLMSVFRELIAFKNNIDLKPVILFKSESIKESIKNHENFVEFINKLDSKDIESFYKNLDSKNTLFVDSFNFFKQYFKEFIFESLKTHIQASFKEHFILNTNDEKELEKNQILLNNLESKDNFIRVIFSVDKLNEGWDVLNLFDIVRLSNKKKPSSGVTTKEAQLIGRGARYYPFLIQGLDSESLYKRKFDSDLGNELSHLERLSYHTINDVDFIKQLDKTMLELGLILETTMQKITLKPNQKIQEKIKNEKIFYAKNEKQAKEGLFKDYDKEKITTHLRALCVPLFSSDIKQDEIFINKGEESSNEEFLISKKINKIIDKKYFLKAMNMLNISFESLQNRFDDYTSKVEFIQKYLGQINILFHKRQNFDDCNVNLEIAKFILENFKELTQKAVKEYKISEFRVYPLDLAEREIFTSKEPLNVQQFEWLYYHNKMTKDSDLEIKFLEFIESKKEDLDSRFEKWFVIRNEGFGEFKIYDNRDKNSPTYAMGFEPDFILFAKKKGAENFFGIECFIEAKGVNDKNEQSLWSDSWKEKFLKEINNKEFKEYINDGENYFYELPFKKPFTIKTLPFFTSENSEKFNKAFEKLLD